MPTPRYRLRPQVTPVSRQDQAHPGEPDDAARAFLRPEAEDDDGYDPYSDRPIPEEPPYQPDPWA